MFLLDAKSFKYIKITASKSFWWYTDSSIPIPASALAVYKLGEWVQSPGKGALPRTLRMELGKIQGQAAGDWLNDLWMQSQEGAICKEAGKNKPAYYYSDMQTIVHLG